MPPLTRLIAPLTAGLLLAAPATAPLAAPAAATPRGNWLQAVAVTPQGGHLLGNPAAKLKLVEYISYTCPHCAAFETQANAAIRLSFVQPGTGSVEVRHLVRDPIDLAVALLTNCGAPARFFANHDAFLLHQADWIGASARASEAQRQRWTTGDLPARMRAIAGDFGFYPIMEQRGYSRAEADRCLGDPAMVKRLTAQLSEAGRLGVDSTPSFLLDGVLLAGTHTWAVLEPQLTARL